MSNKVDDVVGVISSKYGHLLRDKEVKENFYMQEFDGASYGDKDSREWVKNLDIDRSKYENSLDDEDPRPEKIQQHLIMWQMKLGVKLKDRASLRRAVIDELLKRYPLSE